MSIKQKNQNNNLPMILIILDGWGISKPSRGNAITLSKTPNLDKMIKDYPNTKLCAYGKCVGLPPTQDGNSEAGHINIGAGRVVEQDAVKICKTINNGTFFKNPAFLEAIRHVEKNKSALHLMGMLSNGMSAHSDPDHLLALITLARGYNVKKVYLHLFTDGRDSPQYAALKLIESVQRSYLINERVATVMGRFYAMDRKKKWGRAEKAYDALVLGRGKTAKSPQDAITKAYNSGENDEFIQPYVIESNGRQLPRINDGDSVIFFNLRSDRARQLAKVFVQYDFNKINPGAFKRKKVLKDLKFVAMTDFGPDLDGILSAYPSADLKATLPMVLRDLKQLYIAEKEKHSHITYFFNGGYARPVAGESRIILESPDVRSYDETPAMNSAGLTDAVIKNLTPQPPLLIRRGGGAKRQGIGWKYDFTVLNFAAPDMVAHTGNLQAGIECCKHIDKHLSRIVNAYLAREGTVIITSDHGNIEEMVNLETGEIDTEHSSNPVPFIIVNKKLKNKIKLKKEGILGDIAPTALELMGMEKPKEMTGKSLIKN
ncbi:2,3-bisphosphoglycerate-independent phosphoglycerate mutase [Candidatus Parcubacteria bacterium]|nr:2,3-bisphosphoglycerate-independent phosphoglycerate mutase [Candidatus Parcubacteria bacterium]